MGFSDVWVERCEGQSAWLRLDIDGETRANKIVGDGMLVATAAGSSAYARAMGAVPVPLNTSVLALVGSNIFQPRFWKPMAISDESLIRIVNLDETGKRPVRGFIDGIAMGVVQEITVRRSLTAGVEMAFTREFDPSTRLLRSLFPADET
jgi:NAD kinase